MATSWRWPAEGVAMGDEAAITKRPEAEDPGAVVLHGGAGTLALAMMSEAEFESRLEVLKRGQDRIRRIKRELMKEGKDGTGHFGVIPGTKKPTLFKAGAELLCTIYGLRGDFIPTTELGDGEIGRAHV